MGQAYFAHISQNGAVRYGDVPGSIGVLEALDKFMPIGEAHCLTWDQNGLAVWTLRIGKQEIPGLWVIINRRFVEVEGGPDTDREIRARFDRQASATKQRPLPWSLPILIRKTVFFFVSFHRRAMQAWVLFLVSIERGTPMPDLSLPSLAV